jgi:hypothetical protein
MDFNITYTEQNMKIALIFMLCQSSDRSPISIPLGESYAEMHPLLHHYYSPCIKGIGN